MTLPELASFAGGTLATGGDYDAVEFRDLDLSGQSAGNARFLECGIFGCRLDQATLRRGHFVDCVLDESQATSLDVADSSWRDTVISSCRFGALVAHGSDMTRVQVTGGKLDYVNLRGGTATDVVFKGCLLGEIDVGAAQLSRLRFVDCEIELLDVSGARLDEVDLSRSELRRITGLANLAGAVISERQAAELASAFARHLGVRIAATETEEVSGGRVDL